MQDIRDCGFREKSWYMKGDLFYFDVVYGRKTTFACQYKGTAIEWIKSIQVAKDYAKQVDLQIKEYIYVKFSYKKSIKLGKNIILR